MAGMYIKVLLILLFLFNVVVSLQALEILTPEDVVNLKMVTSASISPDGSKIAYVLAVPRAEGNPCGFDYKSPKFFHIIET